ncbi:hypothetical protein EMPS_11413 [Entomortierella parvispora]|uniref:F-box domain-containing protein n=1 Tax=Entomortierella parvispora TaxID=205924 RepID=A0A9P3HLP2_9FUNG|nr:hypothetical protein EMPS_11413 [Entomortierella parvispora]
MAAAPPPWKLPCSDSPTAAITRVFIPDIIDRVIPYLPRNDHCRCCLVSQSRYNLFIGVVWSSNGPYISYRFPQHVQDPVQSKHLFRRVGPHVRYLEIDYNYRNLEILDTFLNIVRDTFWTLKHLKVRYPCLTHQKFERLILGIGAVKDDDDGRASREENEPQGSTGAVARNTLTKKTITRILRSPTNAFLSNSLRHLELIVHPGACESILHWIGLSPRKHRRLQNLEEFRLYPHYHSRKHHHVDNFEVPIHLSLLLLFLRSWNGRKGGAVLKRVAIDFGDVFDDLEEEPTEKDNEEEPFIYVPRFRLRPSDLPPKRGAAQEPRRQSKRQKSDMVHGEIARHCSGILTLSLGQIRSKSALSKLLQRLPCLVALSIHCLDDPTFLKSIRTYAPELTTLQCKTRCSNFREQDWIDYFDLQKQKPRRSEAALGHPYCESCQISSHLNNRLQGLEFGPCVQTSVTDRVLLQIAFPKQASRFHTLDLTGSPGVSCTGVLAMLQNCPGLQTLGVRCGRLDGSMFQENQGPWICYKSLRELELSFIHFNEQGHASLNNESNTKAFRRHLYQLEKLED